MPGQKTVRRPEYGALLVWLSPDPGAAEHEFLRLRNQLIRIFVGRGCSVPEDLTDETIERVALKLPEIAVQYTGDPAPYFYGVARNVHREYLRRPRPSSIEREPRAPAETRDESDENHLKCLDRCLDALREDEHDLILDYYRPGQPNKVVWRKTIASRAGLGVNALRIRAFRIRERLFECLTACLQAATT